MFGLSTAFVATAAQQDKEVRVDDVEVIEVTGVRKRDSETISDSIIAEALSRVAGVSLDRGSYNQTVTVRGLVLH